jgi:hypothetical protein
MSSSISKTLWVQVILIVCLLVNLAAAGNTCMQYQKCKRDDGVTDDTPCPNAKETYNPVLYNWNN